MTPTISFTGHVNDADTDLIYMQQRCYDPVAGRFMSVDPVLTDANNGTSFNRYVYANNSSYKHIDPGGRGATEVGEAIKSGVKHVLNTPARMWGRFVDPSKRFPNGPENAANAAMVLLGGAGFSGKTTAPVARLPQDINVNPVPPSFTT